MDTVSVIESPSPEQVQEPIPTDAATPWWRAMVKSPVFLPAMAVMAGMLFLFWHDCLRAWKLWTDDSGYYTHGFLVPFIAGYVVVRKWPRIKSIPVEPGYWALIPFAIFAYLAYVTTATKIDAILSIAFLGAMLAGICFVAGWRWMLALCLPVLYLGFAMPLWTGAIEFYTNPLQLLSTKVAYYILQAVGFGPLWFKTEPTSIYLNNFTLDVAVPCSGLKLLLAVTAFTCFFSMVAKLKLWGHLAMFAFIFPLCLFINGLRIAMIGMVGSTWGEAAGHQFHDYSGYITLLVCFFILFKTARALGWKD